MALDIERTQSNYPEGPEMVADVHRRRRRGTIWRTTFMASTLVGIIALMALILNIMDGAFGYVAVQNAIDPITLAVDGVAVQDLSKEQLITILEGHVSAGLIRRFERDEPFADRSRANVYDLVVERVIEPTIVDTWSLSDSIFKRSEILATVATIPEGELVFRSWLSMDFITSPQSSVPEDAGVRTAILGSLWVILIVIVVSMPLGVGAAIYLEEYAGDNRLNRLIETNINNLAGVPSIIYGMLGLAIFVRIMEPITSGALLGRGGSHHGQRAHGSLGRPHPGPADPAPDHHQQPGGRAGGAQLLAPGQLWAGGHQVADHLASCLAQRHARHPDRDHPFHLPGHRRDRSPGGDRGLHLHRGGPVRPVQQVHHPAHPDLPVDLPPPG